MRKLTVAAVTVLTMLASAGILRAAADPLEAIPESAGVVVRMKTPKATLGRIADFAGKADPSWKAFLNAGSERLGLLVYNKSLAGVDDKGDWWVAVFPTAGGDPGILFAVPVKDAEAAKKETGTNYQYAKFENWLLYTDHMPTFQAVESRVKGEGKSIAPLIDRVSRGLIDGADVSAYVNAKQLRETYRADLDKAKKEAENGIKNLGNAQPAAPGVDLAAGLAVYGEIAKAAFQAIEDIEGYVIAGSVRDSGLDIEQYLKVTGSSPTDKFLQANTPSELAAINKLPAGQLVYYGMHGDTQSLMDWGMKVTSSMLDSSNNEAKKAYEEIAGEISKLKLGDNVGAFTLGTLDEGLMRFVTLVQVDQPEKMREAFRKTTEAMAKMSVGPIKQEVTIEKDAEKYGERSADIMKLKQEITPETDPFGFAKKMQEMMYGPEGMVTRVVMLKDGVVQTIGGGKEAMEATLKSVDGPSASGADPRKPARDKLSKQANAIVLLNLAGLVTDGLKLAAGSGAVPIPLDAEAIGKLEVKPSYIGTSVTTEAQAVRVKTNVPVEQFQGIAGLVKMFASMAGGPPPAF